MPNFFDAYRKMPTPDTRGAIQGLISAFDTQNKAVSNLGNTLTAHSDKAALQAQQELTNKREEARLKIQQAQEADRVKDVNRVANDRKAVTNAIQSQLLSPELLTGTEDVYNRIDSQFKDTVDPTTRELVVNPDKLAAYERANQAMMPGGSLRKEFTSPLDTTAYQQRVMNDLAGASPEAQNAASTLLKAKYPGSDNLAEYQKAKAKILNNTNTALNKAVGAAGITTTTTGGGTGSSGSSGDSAGNNSYVGIADTLATKGGLGENWNPKSIDASQLRSMSTAVQQAGGKVKVDGKDYTLSRNEWADVIKSSIDPKNGNFIYNEGLDSDAFKTAVKRLAGSNPDKGSKYGNGDKVTTKNLSASARKEIAENEATAIANLQATYGIGAAGASEKPADAVARIFKGVLDDTGNDNLAKVAKVVSTADSSKKKAPNSTFKQDTLIGDAMNVSTPNKLMLDAIAEPDRFYKEFSSLSKPQQNKVTSVLEKSAVPEGPEPVTQSVPKEVVGGTTVTPSSPYPEELQRLIANYNNITPPTNYSSFNAGVNNGKEFTNSSIKSLQKSIAEQQRIIDNPDTSPFAKHAAQASILKSKANLAGNDAFNTAIGSANYVLDSIGDYFSPAGSKAADNSVKGKQEAASAAVQKYIDENGINSTLKDADFEKFTDSLLQEDAEATLSRVLNREDNLGVAEFNRKVKEASRANPGKSINAQLQEIVPFFDTLSIEDQAALYKMFKANAKR